MSVCVCACVCINLNSEVGRDDVALRPGEASWAQAIPRLFSSDRVRHARWQGGRVSDPLLSHRKCS